MISHTRPSFSVRPELGEGLHFFSHPGKKQEQPFGKLRANGSQSERQAHHTHADTTISESFWKRAMLAAWVMTPAVRQAKLTSSSGSTQNSALPAP